MKNAWSTDRKKGDSVEVNDGTLRYYTGRFNSFRWLGKGRVIWSLKDIADEFADTYNHNDIDGPVDCVVTRLSTGTQYRFTIFPAKEGTHK